MRRLIGMFVLGVVTLAVPASAADTAPYYLALGDSLAIGVQPVNGTYQPTKQGYADDLYALLRFKKPSLKLVKLGCLGESTTTMIAGGKCSYSAGSQLNEAVAFLQTHRVALITLDIGADNVLGCITLAGGVDLPCLQEGVSTTLTDLVTIIQTLRFAAPTVPIVAMNYFDSYLGAWILGPEGQSLAVESLQLTTAFNDALENLYTTFGVKVADVESAFHTTDFTTVPFLNLPLNVAVALNWTWAGAPPPNGPDIHPNAIGYAVIAGAFAKAIAGF